MTENAIAGAEGALRESCGTMAFESFLGEASEADFDRVRLSLPELKEQIELKDQLCKEARLKRQKLESELERRCQTEIVNEAAARRESAAATIAEYANEYARVRIKTVLLRKAVQLYTEKHQDPLLARVSEYFRDLTCGRYIRVRIEQADANRYLVAVRGDGKFIGVDEMSDGTRDQLFLALRMAHVANHCETAEACPLVLDDVLMAFDDERASATISVLAKLSKATQVVIFTHHRHHVELAQKALSDGEFTLHELAA